MHLHQQAMLVRIIKEMRTTISVADELLENARVEAERRGVTVSVVMEDALREHLMRSRSKGSKRPPFRLITVNGSAQQGWKFGEKRASEWLAEEDAEKQAKLER